MNYPNQTSEIKEPNEPECTGSHPPRDGLRPASLSGFIKGVWQVIDSISGETCVTMTLKATGGTASATSAACEPPWQPWQRQVLTEDKCPVQTHSPCVRLAFSKTHTHTGLHLRCLPTVLCCSHDWEPNRTDSLFPVNSRSLATPLEFKPLQLFQLTLQWM